MCSQLQRLKFNLCLTATKQLQMPTCNLAAARNMATFQQNMNNHNMFTALLYIPPVANAET